MTKIIGLLMAVVLTPAYSTYYSLNEEGPTAIDYEGDYYFSFVLNEEGTDGDFIGTAYSPLNPNPFPLEYCCKLEPDELIIENYYTSFTFDLTFNPEVVNRFGACTLELKYGNSQVVTVTYAVSYFANNQFNFGFNNRFNSTWTRSSNTEGNTITINVEKEIEQNNFYLYFYAYQIDSNLIIQDSYNDGYNTGYNEGYDVGLNDNVFTLDWLTQGVAGFLDVDIFGTFGIGDILLLFLGAFLMIYLLKVFAGG